MKPLLRIVILLSILAISASTLPVDAKSKGTQTVRVEPAKATAKTKSLSTFTPQQQAEIDATTRDMQARITQLEDALQEAVGGMPESQRAKYQDILDMEAGPGYVSKKLKADIQDLLTTTTDPSVSAKLGKYLQ